MKRKWLNRMKITFLPFTHGAENNTQSSLFFPFLSTVRGKPSRLCDERKRHKNLHPRDLCAKVTKHSESSVARAAFVAGWWCWAGEGSGGGLRRWHEMCFVCRERWEKIWFRGWSWTTYNNELNIWHSVYLHHKEINVSSTFERKICDVGVCGVWVDWGLLVFHVLVSCAPFTSLTRRH